MWKRLLTVAKGMVVRWTTSRATVFAAAVAFYTLMSLAPTLVFATTAATRWLGREESRNTAIHWLEQAVGPESAEVARSVLESDSFSRYTEQTVLATIPSALLLLLGASGVFVQLRMALNLIFESRAHGASSALLSWLRGRLISLVGAVLGGLLLLGSLLSTVALQAANTFLSGLWGGTEQFWAALSWPLSVVLLTAVFWVTYYALPSARPAKRWLLVGAVTATIGFEVGRWLLSIYLSKSLIMTAYGPASSLVAFLVWVYYTTNVFLLGAVVAQSLAQPHDAEPS